MSALTSLFRRKRTAVIAEASETAEAPIAAGQKWLFVGRQRGPWPTNESGYRPVLILDVRDGWVRYEMGRIFRDERMRAGDFIAMYRRVA